LSPERSEGLGCYSLLPGDSLDSVRSWRGTVCLCFEKAHLHEQSRGPLAVPEDRLRNLERRPLALAAVAVADAALLVQTECITRLADNTRAGEVVSLASVKLETEPVRQLDSNLTVEIDQHGYLSASHSARRGQPAATQA